MSNLVKTRQVDWWFRIGGFSAIGGALMGFWGKLWLVSTKGMMPQFRKTEGAIGRLRLRPA